MGNIFHILDALDQQPPSYSLPRKMALRRTFQTLATVAVCLLIIHYLKFFSSFQAFLGMLSEWQGLPASAIYRGLQRTGFVQLISYGWWTSWHLVGYVLIPCLLIKTVFRQNIRDFGLGFGNLGRHWGWYLALLLVILFLVVVASFRADFQHTYPFYRQAERSVFDLLCWETLYLAQFVFLEFFFRGFMLQALRPALGATAVWVMCVPYMMIHFVKPWPEATGAILFGLFLGILALRSGSIWGGVVVHTGVAVSMDVAALLQKGAFPGHLWPN